MSTLTVELALWMLLAFFVGCIIGCILHAIFAASRSRALAMAAQEGAAGPHQWTLSAVEHAGSVAPPPAGEAAPPVASPAASPAASVTAAPAESSTAASRPAMKPAAQEPAEATPAKPRPPQGLSAPPEGGGDNLQRISGVGPKIERTLNRLGIYRYQQIAAWTADEVHWVDGHLKFSGRVAREEWIMQARLLAAGDEEEFGRQFGTGGVKDASGKSRSGAHTRRKRRS